MDRIGLGEPHTASTAHREFWRRALLAGGYTALPRWTLEPVRGSDVCEVGIRDDLVAALLWLATSLGVSLRSVLLAAHARVLATLSGESEVATGYVARKGSSPLPFRITVEPGSWRTLLLQTERAEQELLSHADLSVGAPGRELGLGGPWFETVLDPAAGDDGGPSGDTVLHIGILERDGIVIRVRHRTDVLDSECAARIAGYHLTALESIAADPDAEHASQSLLTNQELQFQLHGLAGPRRELPERRVHELFEDQVRAHPDAIAAVHGDRHLTYGQLNRRANELARDLLARGLWPEDIVAVVTGRNLDWLAAVLGIFKAGGAYLPIEPHFPADRMATMLTRSGCRFVIREHGATAALDRALESMSGVQMLDVDDARAEHRDGSDPGIPLAPGQLAYVSFTSGSTGEPKGVMCEHAGMLNHLYAKIHDLAIGVTSVVAQTAPQCFDISLWQLLAALLAGGRTLLVEQEAILDAQRFIDRIVEGKVSVLQVVPSYLDVLLS